MTPNKRQTMRCNTSFASTLYTQPPNCLHKREYVLCIYNNNIKRTSHRFRYCFCVLRVSCHYCGFALPTRNVSATARHRQISIFLTLYKCCVSGFFLINRKYIRKITVFLRRSNELHLFFRLCESQWIATRVRNWRAFCRYQCQPDIFKLRASQGRHIVSLCQGIQNRKINIKTMVGPQWKGEWKFLIDFFYSKHLISGGFVLRPLFNNNYNVVRILRLINK